MIGADVIKAELESLVASDEFEQASVPLADRYEAEGIDLDGVAAIIAFMETQPEIDFGPPGPLSHLIERFHRKGYDELLIDSVERSPTEHTTWLLRRLVNGEKNDPERRAMLAAIHADAERRLA